PTSNPFGKRADASQHQGGIDTDGDNDQPTQSMAEGGPVADDRDPEPVEAGQQYADSGGNKGPQGTVKAMPIRSKASLNKALNHAEGDDDLNAIQKRMEKRGYDTSSYN